MKYAGTVLRARTYRESDVMVDLLIGDLGRVSAIARGARRSQKRFGGALETGARLHVEMTRRGTSGLYSLRDCHIVSVPLKARRDLARFYQLAYVVELMNRICVEGHGEHENLAALTGYLDLLEVTTPGHLDLVQWELFVLAQNGYALRFWPCCVTGGDPSAVSLSSGGAIDANRVNTSDTLSLNPLALKALETIRAGASANCSDEDHAGIRHMLNHVWQQILGQPMKSTEFLGPGCFVSPGIPETSNDGPPMDLH